jgi:hypothetical protein
MVSMSVQSTAYPVPGTPADAAKAFDPSEWRAFSISGATAGIARTNEGLGEGLKMERRV